MPLLKVPILQGFAYHKRQPGEAGSHKLITGLSFPCSIHGEVVMGSHPPLQPMLSICELWYCSSKAGMCTTLQKSRHLSTHSGNRPSKPYCWTCSLTYRRLSVRQTLLFSSPFSAYGNCQAPISFFM